MAQQFRRLAKTLYDFGRTLQDQPRNEVFELAEAMFQADPATRKELVTEVCKRFRNRKVEPPYSDIHASIASILNLAKLTGQVIRMDFNGVRIAARPDSNFRNLHDTYWEKLTRQKLPVTNRIASMVSGLK